MPYSSRDLASLATALTVLFGITASLNEKAEAAESASNPNAASLYAEAFDQLNQLDHPDAKRLGSCGPDGCWVESTPISSSTRELLSQAAPALLLVQRAHTATELTWPSPSSHPRALIERAQLARSITGLLVLKAREQLLSDQSSQGISFLVMALAVSRQAAFPASYMTQLIEIGAARSPTTVLAQHLPDLTPTQLDSLSEALEQLPPTPMPSQVILGEYAYGISEAKQRVERKEPSAELVLRSFEALEDFYRKLANQATLPPKDFADLVKTQTEAYPKNFLVRAMGPMITNQYQQGTAALTRFALLKAGIAILQQGDAAVKLTKEPFATGPFQHETIPVGFRLTRHLSHRGQAVSLSFGR